MYSTLCNATIFCKAEHSVRMNFLLHDTQIFLISKPESSNCCFVFKFTGLIDLTNQILKAKICLSSKYSVKYLNRDVTEGTVCRVNVRIHHLDIHAEKDVDMARTWQVQ